MFVSKNILIYKGLQYAAPFPLFKTVKTRQIELPAGSQKTMISFN